MTERSFCNGEKKGVVKEYSDFQGLDVATGDRENGRGRQRYVGKGLHSEVPMQSFGFYDPVRTRRVNTTNNEEDCFEELTTTI